MEIKPTFLARLKQGLTSIFFNLLSMVLGIGIVILIFIFIFYRGEKKEFDAFENKVLQAGFDKKILSYKIFVIRSVEMCHACRYPDHPVHLESDTQDIKIENRQMLERYRKGFAIELFDAFPKYFSNQRGITSSNVICHEGRLRRNTLTFPKGSFENYFYLDFLQQDPETGKKYSNQSQFWKGTCTDSFLGWVSLENKKYFVNEN